MEIKRTDWIICKDGPWYPNLGNGGLVAYRIWKKTDGYQWFQRHEWKGADGAIQMDEWIRSIPSFNDGHYQ